MTRDGENTPTPVEVPEMIRWCDDDTGRTSTQLYATLSGVGAAPPVAPQDVLEILAAKVAAKVNGGGGRPPPKKFLGLAQGKWVQMLFGLLVTAVAVAFTWVLFVRDDLKVLHLDQEHHEIHGHDKTNKAIVEVQRVQTIQGVKLEHIDRGIGEIKEELRND